MPKRNMKPSGYDVRFVNAFIPRDICSGSSEACLKSGKSIDDDRRERAVQSKGMDGQSSVPLRYYRRSWDYV